MTDLGVDVPFLDLGSLHQTRRDEIDRAVASVIDSSRFIGGHFVEEFERAFASYCERSECIGVGNGTDALELIFRALGIGPGDEVIVPANTFVATAEAVVVCGARPRFVDVSDETLLMSPGDVAAAIGPSTAAIVAVHLFGQMADVDALGALAAAHGLALVEDAAQAHGARFDGHRAGSRSTAAAFSFYPGKNLGALGDGGAVVTDDAGLAGAIRCLADHGRVAGTRWEHETSGRNSRLDGLQAAVLSTKLRHLDDDNAARVRAMGWYRERLPAHIVPVAVHPLAEPVHHLAIVRTADREDACRRLDDAGIGWGLHYPIPCHRQPAFARYAADPLPVVEAAADEILSLPMFPTITVDQVEWVCATLRGA